MHDIVLEAIHLKTSLAELPTCRDRIPIPLGDFGRAVVMDAAGQDVEGAPVLFVRWRSLDGEHDCGLELGVGLRRRSDIFRGD